MATSAVHGISGRAPVSTKMGRVAVSSSAVPVPASGTHAYPSALRIVISFGAALFAGGAGQAMAMNAPSLGLAARWHRWSGRLSLVCTLMLFLLPLLLKIITATSHEL